MRSYLIPHIVANAVERVPDHVAFKHGADALSYEALWTEAGCLARALHEMGARKGDRIGACFGRSIKSAVALYGITLLGCVYVPLDPKSPKSRIRSIASSCDMSILLVDEMQTRSLLSEEGGLDGVKHLVGTNRVIGGVKCWSWADVASLKPIADLPKGVDGDLAYILHTSGTTGVPKGIMHSHYSALSFASLAAELYDLQSDDVFGLHSPAFFDASMMGYLSVPYAMGRSIIIPELYAQMVGSLAKLFSDEKITIWYSVPYVLIQLLEIGAFEKYDYEHLNWLLYMGEPFPLGQLRQLMERLPHVRFSNVYGPTETNQCTYYHLPDIPSEDVPLGYVWGNSSYKVVDRDDHEVSGGEEGELVIRSATTMLGYWKRPDLNEKAFYTETTDTGQTEKYYRTGDRVRVDQEDRIHYLGRADRQLKIRGNRVELLEVESAILAIPGVREAACVAPKMGEDRRLLIALVSLELELSPSVEEIKQLLATTLPGYAVPEEIRVVKQLPRNPTGKVDYRKLTLSLTETE